MKRRGFLVIAVFCFMFTMAVPLFHPSTASASGQEVLTPPSAATTGTADSSSDPSASDLLLAMTKYCQGVSGVGENDNDNGVTGACDYIQNQLQSALNCSTNMYTSYSIPGTDADGNPTTSTKWYINEAEYKSCWENADSQLTELNTQACASTDKSSTNWTPCTNAQDHLNAALGANCSKNLYDNVKGTTSYTLNQTRLATCTAEYTKAGAVQLQVVSSSGQVTTDPHAISDPAVQDSSTDPADAPDASVPTCETSGFSLSFIVCPIVDAMANGADDIYNDIIHPLLVTQPIDLSNDANDPSHTFAVWSDFRIYGDIFLIIALLVIVFGESIGGGLLDAYSVKKVLPRLLIAAVLINLSIYIVAFAVDITNVLGGGIEALLEEPFKSAGSFTLSLSGGASGIGLAAMFGAVGVIWKLHIIGEILPVLAFVVILPAFLTLLAIFATVVIRRGLILFLIFISPIAFVLYCLPNTEKYFRRWWDLLMRTLLVYPLIAIFFAMGNILSVTIGQTSSGLDKVVASFISEIVLFVPLILIPYSFRIAGGVLGRAHEFATTARDSAHKMTEGKRQSTKARLTHSAIQGRQDWYSNLKDNASKDYSGRGRAGKLYGRTRNFALGSASRAVGGYNIEARASNARNEVEKEVNDQIGNGHDSEVRGLLIDKSVANNKALEGEEWRVDKETGKRQFKSLGGAWIDEADVDAGQRRWGHSTYAKQAALAYEMRKADTVDDVKHIANNYRTIAKAGGMSDQQAGGVWLGAAYEQADKHLEFKHTNWATGKMDAKGAASYASEVYEKRGSYSMAQMHASSIDRLTEAYGLAKDEGDTATMHKLEAVADTFVSRYGGASGIGGEPEQQIQAVATQNNLQAQIAAERQRLAATPGATIQPGAQPDATREPYVSPTIVQTNTPGAAHTAQSVRNFAIATGRLKPLNEPTDIGPKSDSGIPRTS